MTNPIPGIRQFYEETIQEIKKCTWPSFNELFESTTVVILSLILLTVFIWLIDLLSQWLIRFFILS